MACFKYVRLSAKKTIETICTRYSTTSFQAVMCTYKNHLGILLKGRLEATGRAGVLQARGDRGCGAG